MNGIILVTKDYRVRLEYAGEGVVLEVSTAYDVEPPDQQIKPHYFENHSKAKAWMIENSYALLRVGYEIVEG